MELERKRSSRKKRDKEKEKRVEKKNESRKQGTIIFGVARHKSGVLN